MPTNSLTSQGSAAAAPEPTSSVMVNSGWQSISGTSPLSTMAASLSSVMIDGLERIWMRPLRAKAVNCMLSHSLAPICSVTMPSVSPTGSSVWANWAGNTAP